MLSTSSALNRTTTSKWWHLTSKVAWLGTAALLLALFVASVPLYFVYVQTVCISAACESAPTPPPGFEALGQLGISPTFYGAYYAALDIVVALSYFTVAAAIFWHRRRDPLALLGSFTLLIWGLVSVPYSIGAFTTYYPSWQPAHELALFVGLVCLTLFFYLFPGGYFAPSWIRWLLVVVVALLLPGYLWPQSLLDYRHTHPLIGYSILLVWMGSVIGVQIYRYVRVSDTMQRQQTKWIVFGVPSALVFYLGLAQFLYLSSGNGVDLVWQMAANTGMSLSMLLIPLSFAAAILRHRLWDIDIIIKRALVYGALTIIVVSLYVISVVALGALFQTGGNLFISLLATSIVAILFQPLRESLQRAANRLVYGDRDDPYAVISYLSKRLEGTLEPGAVLPTIAETVAQALKLPYVAISLKENNVLNVMAEHGRPSGEPIHVPLVYQGERIGELLVAPRTAVEPLTNQDVALLNNVAHQVGVAAHAVQLTANLQRSREQLVSAREEERRRLRRDLHDGLGPALAAQTLKVGSARALLSQDPAAADALLAQLENDIEVALADVRRLVYNLRPPALDELGLLGAIREIAAQYTYLQRNAQAFGGRLLVEVEAPDKLVPLPAAVEVAAYRIVQEALTNVVHHSGATYCLVRLLLQDTMLIIEVADKGGGLVPRHKTGVGLASMRERAEELGGTCLVESGTGTGTRVLARLPLEG